MFKSIIYQSCRDGATAYWVLPVLLGVKASYSRTQNGGGRFTLGIVIFIYQVQKLRKEAKSTGIIICYTITYKRYIFKKCFRL